MSTIVTKWLALSDVTLAPGVSYCGRKGPGSLALEFSLDDFDREQDLRDEVQEILCSESITGITDDGPIYQTMPVELPK